MLFLYYNRRVVIYPFVQGVQLIRALGRSAWGVSFSHRTYRTEPAITRHLRYLLVRKGVTPALSGVRDGRNREGNAPVIGRIDLF
jgi:hypothetical protein